MPLRACIRCHALYRPGNPTRCAGCAAEADRAHNRAHTARRAAAPGNGARRRLRSAVNRAGGANCALCGIWHPAAGIEIDHMMRLADGGRDDDDNVRALCKGCHATKTRRGA